MLCSLAAGRQTTAASREGNGQTSRNRAGQQAAPKCHRARRLHRGGPSGLPFIICVGTVTRHGIRYTSRQEADQLVGIGVGQPIQPDVDVPGYNDIDRYNSQVVNRSGNLQKNLNVMVANSGRRRSVTTHDDGRISTFTQTASNVSPRSMVAR
jgi:hypothetical protein